MTVHKMTKAHTWDVHEYHYVHNDPDWFWWIVLAGTIGVVVALLVHNGLLALFFGIAAILFVIFSLRHPELVRVEISEEGISVDDTMYKFENTEAFWIQQDHRGDYHILLHIERHMFPVVSVPIEGQEDIGQIRDFLINLLPEQEIREPYFQKLLDELGF